MTVKWRKSFKKDFNKLNLKQKESWYKTWLVFRCDQRNKKLRRHKLAGKYKGLDSIDISSDLRALFSAKGKDFIFYYIKNHNQLYS